MIARLLARISAAAFALASLALSACGSTPPSSTTACPTPPVTSRLDPNAGHYFGVNLDWANDSPSEYASRLQRTPAVFVQFAAFPPSDAEWKNIDDAVTAIRESNAALMLTLEPNAGLDSITADSAQLLATRLRSYNELGTPILLRFAHEMNGSWYAWSQQPAAYRTAFRAISEAVHATAPATSMVWAPNYGGGYPFSGGRHEASPGTPDFTALDTNHDGALTMGDDPYAPYYPGDDAVDWVGMSLYHWGSAYPWGENERPEPGKFVAQLRGHYIGLGGNDLAVPDFYADYSIARSKPLAIPETAAFHAPAHPGDDPALIKSEWWDQVFAALAELPAIGMVNWFEWDKVESEVSDRVDWTATRDPALAAAFRAALPPSLHFATPASACRTP